MSPDPETRRFYLGGVPVSVVTKAGLIAALERRLSLGAAAPGAFVVFRDAHGIVRAQDDTRLAAAHQEALLVCPDGRPLVWIARLRGHREVEQVAGIEAVEAVCRAGLQHGWRHYFLGGGPGVAQRLAHEMTRSVPGLQVAGFETPPFRPLDAEETQAMRARIRGCGAQVVWVGLGTPKQEFWMAEHAPFLPGTVAMGVGAAFDVNTGGVPRAPAVMRRAGLEWFYRVVREPRRLWRRYATVVPRFLMIVAREMR